MAGALPLGLLFAATLAAAPQQSAVVHGSIVDPHGAPVAGASIALRCRDAAVSTVTDADGRFSLSSPTGLRTCVVTVSHPGFAAETRPADARGHAIQLRIAPVVERVSVAGLAVAIAPSFPSAASADLDASQLRVAGGNSSDWVRYARAWAGAGASGGVISVDGLETGTLPPAAVISRIQVNADPFSAEFGEPGAARIEISTRGPDRAFKWSLGGTAFGAGGGNPLAAGAGANSDGITVGASGGLPGLPITFVTAVDLSHDAIPASVQTPLEPAGATITDRRSARLSASLFNRSGGTAWHARYIGARARADRTGAGGISAVDASRDETSDRHELHLTGARPSAGYLFRGGAALLADRRASTGNARAAAIEIPGVMSGGASAIDTETSTRRSVSVTLVAEGRRGARPLQAGLTLNVTDHDINRTPNPHGRMMFASWQEYQRSLLEHESSGTLFQMQGHGRARVTTVQASAFMQRVVSSGTRGTLRAGLRVDHQTRDRVRLSPRLYGTWRLRRFSLAGGTGLFTHNTAPELFTRITLGDAAHLREIIVNGVPWDPSRGHPLDAAPYVARAFDPDYRRRSDFVARGSIARELKSFRTQLEYTYTRGRHAAGTVRSPSVSGWQDDLMSRFGVVRHHVHASAGWRQGHQAITAHAEAVSARDQSSGALSVQSSADPDAANWAPTAGIPGLRASVVGAFVLPASVALSIVVSLSGGAPYDVVSGGLAGDYSFTERAGRPRNSGRGSSTGTVDAHAFREFTVPGPLRKLIGPRASAGARVENVLNRTNVTARGGVIGTPLFGRPIDAAPSRAIRLWVSF